MMFRLSSARREANVYRLAELSLNIIDQCVAQGVPFAREYGGLLANRSFGGAQVSRTFYARGQTGQQLLLGAYQALCRSEEHTSELQSLAYLVCRLLLEKKKKMNGVASVGPPREKYAAATQEPTR